MPDLCDVLDEPRLPPQLHAERLHQLAELYLAEALEHGDLGALGPLRLLRDRVEVLLAEHARAAHDVDGRPWREVADVLGVTTSAVTAWARTGAGPVPRPQRRMDEDTDNLL